MGMDVENSEFYRQIKQIFTNAQRIAEAELYQQYPDLRHAAMNRRATEALQKSNRPDVALQRILSVPK
jgi:TRAP-type mannitol/chloroaromatic compound transport system substrate-binding protein